MVSTASPSETETPEAKDEPVKEESPAVRPKMEATTPQKVHLYQEHKLRLLFMIFFYVLLFSSYFPWEIWLANKFNESIT